MYTLPVITDTSNMNEDGTPKAISDSWNIVVYLEERFPGSSEKSVLPDGSKGLQMFYQDHLHRNLYFGALAAILAPRVIPFLNVDSQV